MGSLFFMLRSMPFECSFSLFFLCSVGFCPEQIRTVPVSPAAQSYCKYVHVFWSPTWLSLSSHQLYLWWWDLMRAGWVSPHTHHRAAVEFKGPAFTVDIFPLHDLSMRSSYYLILLIAGLHHLTLNARRSPHQSSKIAHVCSSPPGHPWPSGWQLSRVVLLVSEQLWAGERPCRATAELRHHRSVFCDSTLPSHFYSHTVKAVLSVSTKWPYYEWKGFKLCSIQFKRKLWRTNDAFTVCTGMM